MKMERRGQRWRNRTVEAPLVQRKIKEIRGSNNHETENVDRSDAEEMTVGESSIIYAASQKMR